MSPEMDDFDLPISPERARGQLESWDITEDNWDYMMGEYTQGAKPYGSHTIRALIVIARGSSKRSWAKVCTELRQAEISACEVLQHKLNP